MRRALLAMWSLFCVPTAQAEVARFSGFIGGWAYDISGRYTNTSELDLQDDLALMTTARQSYALAYRPARLGWVPALELDYIRIAADGEQRFQNLPGTPLDPLAGLLVPAETVVEDRTSVNDFELTARWPWQRGAFRLLGGLTVRHLDGFVRVADESSGQQQTQPIKETFPLLSLGLEWQPVQSLRLSLSGDYVRYDGNQADEIDARIVWKVLGPIALEGGYRQRRYQFVEPMNALDAKVAGARIGLVLEIPAAGSAQ